jgi:hypothetical protein
MGLGGTHKLKAAATGTIRLKTAVNVEFDLPDVLGRISRFPAVTH